MTQQKTMNVLKLQGSIDAVDKHVKHLQKLLSKLNDKVNMDHHEMDTRLENVEANIRTITSSYGVAIDRNNFRTTVALAFGGFSTLGFLIMLGLQLIPPLEQTVTREIVAPAVAESIIESTEDVIGGALGEQE